MQMNSSDDNLLEAKGLTRRLGRSGGVADITLSLKRGEVLGLLGLNGAGKSTTLRLLAGVLAPDAGEVRIGGQDLYDEPLSARRLLGYLPDQPPVYPDMKVGDYLRFCARLHRMTRTDADERIAIVLAECDLEAVANKRIETLSRGFTQRVGLAQAILHQPAVLLLDEPGNGLDPHQTQTLRRVIAAQAEHAAVVFSTHLLREAQQACTRIAVIHQGRLQAERAVRPGDTELENVFDALLKGSPENAGAPHLSPTEWRHRPSANTEATPDLSTADE